MAALSETETTTKRAALSLEQSYQYIGVSRAMLYRLLDAGLVQSFHIGSRRLVLIDELDRYIQSRIDAESGLVS